MHVTVDYDLCAVTVSVYWPRPKSSTFLTVSSSRTA